MLTGKPLLSDADKVGGAELSPHSNVTSSGGLRNSGGVLSVTIKTKVAVSDAPHASVAVNVTVAVPVVPQASESPV